MTELLKLADGHDNFDDLAALRELFPPLFRRYRHPLTEWHPYESRELDGDRHWRTIGLPWTAWILGVVYPDEMDYLLTTFGDDVTIYTFVKSEDRFGYFNATFWQPDLNEVEWMESRGAWNRVRLEFRDLTEITPP